MRYVVALLAAANVAFFLWEYTHRAPPTEPAAVPDEVPRLVLLSERTQADAEAPASTADSGAQDASSNESSKTSSTQSPAAGDAEAETEAAPPPATEPGSAEAQAGPTVEAKPAPRRDEDTGKKTGTTSAPTRVAERNNASTEASPADDEAPASEGEPARCYRLGPYTEAELANAVAGRLRERDIEPAVHSDEQERLYGHWVYIPSPGDLDKARAITRDLKTQGLEDYYILGEGEHRHAISVGVFSQSESVERRREAVRSMGYDTRTEPRYDRSTVYWIDYRRRGEATLPAALWRPEGASDGVKLEVIDCRKLSR